MVDEVAARAWDSEYAAGRYLGEPPVGFVADIVAAAREAGAVRGLYIGCGNGRNYIPLTAAGLDLTGLDISATAIGQLTARLPEQRDRLVTGDLSALPAGPRFPLEGPKTGMTVHFWAARELDSAVSAAGFSPVLPLRPQATWRAAREQGLWLQWEGIYGR